MTAKPDYPRWGLWLGLGATLFALLLNAALSWRSIASLIDQGAWVRRTHEVLVQLKDLRFHLSQADRALRNYARDRRPHRLRAFHDARPQLRRTLAELTRQTADNATHAERMTRLRPQLEGHTGDLEPDEPPAGPGLERVLRDRAAAPSLAEVFDLIDQMETEEERLLEERAVVAGRGARLAYLTLAAASVALIGLLALVTVLLRRTLRDREKIEAGLRERADQMERAEQRLREVAEAMPQIVYIADPVGQILYVNDHWRHYTGHDNADPGAVAQAIHPDDVSRMYADWQRSLDAGVPCQTEIRIRRGSDGTYRWFLSRTVPSRDASGTIVRWYGTSTDIDDQKRAEERLEQRVAERASALELVSARLGAVLAGATRTSIVAVDLNGRITLFNTGAERLFGYRAEEMVGRRTPEILHIPEEVEEYAQQLSRRYGRPVVGFEVFIAVARDEGVPDEREWTCVRKDGSRLTIDLAVTALRDDNGELSGFLGVCTDVTDRKNAEAELRRAKEAAEAANEAKGQFLANISHEIRTPMNGILGMTELALDTDLTPEQRDYLEMVRSSARSMLTVINDILDFSKIEAGKLDLDPQPLAFREVLTDTVRPLALRARRKGVALSAQISPDLPDELIGDAGRLRQVLNNLIGNAVKFTEAGQIAVSARAREVGPGYVVLEVTVRDTGIGIPEDKREVIFRPFEQADTSSTRRYDGTGLGLTIASRLVSLLGGQIGAESQPGVGSTFWFTARLRRQPPREAGQEPPRPAARVGLERPVHRSLHLLLAEDNPVNQQVATLLLQRHGYRVTVVSGGQEALDRLARETFDAVLMDLQMPGMDGAEATARLRERERGTGRHVPVIAVTAHAMPGDRERCLAAGMDGYVAKPVELEDLEAELGAVLSPAGPPPLDVPGVLRRVGSVAALRELIGVFHEDSQRRVASLRASLDGGDLAAMEKPAHSLRGALAYLSAGPGAAAAEAVERAARRRDAEAAAAALVVLERELGRLREALAAVADGT